MTIITPSQWLADLVKQSFLCDIPVVVINNGIDLDLFKPTESDFREKYGIPKEKKILLGVANKWEKRKGLDVFIRLAETLEQEKFQIVLVGTNDGVDKQLPANVISIHRTSNQKELAEIYSAADLFVNPTREDNFPTVNLESLACGTPVIAFNTGGCAEMLNEYCGCIVPKNNVDQIYDSIHRVVSDSMISSEKCIAQAQKYKAEDKFIEYIKLYS